MRSRNGASGRRIGVSSKADPSAEGVHSDITMPFGHVYDAQPMYGRGRVRTARQSGDHAVEERQRDCRTETAKHRAAGSDFFVTIMTPPASF